MNEAVIEVSDLTKSYGKVRALNGLTMQVERGEVHGYLGPNGAGKTTTIRVLLGLLKRDSGEAKVFGVDPWRDAVDLHRRLAYVPGDVELWPSLSGGQAIDVLSRLRGGVDRKRVEHLASRFDLDLTKKGRTYSKGNRQKVALVAALAADVELLVLDEPTSGLDPLMEAVFQECVREARESGTTVLLSSHILAQVEVLADRVSIVRDGAIVEVGTLTQLQSHGRTEITATVTGAVPRLEAVVGIHDLTVEGATVHCAVDAGALDTVMKTLADAGVNSLVARPPTLEQLLLRHYGHAESTVA